MRYISEENQLRYSKLNACIILQRGCSGDALEDGEGGDGSVRAVNSVGAAAATDDVSTPVARHHCIQAHMKHSCVRFTRIMVRTLGSGGVRSKHEQQQPQQHPTRPIKCALFGENFKTFSCRCTRQHSTPWPRRQSSSRNRCEHACLDHSLLLFISDPR